MHYAQPQMTREAATKWLSRVNVPM